MWTAPESPTPTPLASWSSGAVIDCYVTNDKCKLYDLINIRSSWRVLIPDKLSGGWLFKLKNGTQINVTNYGNIICTILGTNGQFYYIPSEDISEDQSALTVKLSGCPTPAWLTNNPNLYSPREAPPLGVNPANVLFIQSVLELLANGTAPAAPIPPSLPPVAPVVPPSPPSCCAESSGHTRGTSFKLGKAEERFNPVTQTWEMVSIE